MLENNFKLIILKDGTFELYDLSTDLKELNNLSEEKSELVNRMYEAILKIRKENQRRKQTNSKKINTNHVDVEKARRET